MNHLYNAVLSHFKSQEFEALAALDIYFNKSVGISEHSNFLQEIEGWVEKLTNAKENIKTLEEMIKFTEENFNEEEKQ
jgi:hypothetical protein